jgi:hypothetical protein
MKMQYNVCGICGAKDGRAGLLMGNPTQGLVDACANCNDTRKTGEIVIHANLIRTEEEIKKTLAILNTTPTINNTLVLYAVRNSKGQFFRAKGYSGSGATWVDDINKAKIYGGTGGARGTITWFANHCPNYPTPELIKLTVTGMEVMDETARIKKAQERKLKAEQEREARNAKYELEQAQRKLDEAQARLNKLKSNL